MVGIHNAFRKQVRREHPSGGWILFELDDGGFLRAACGLEPGQTLARDMRLAEALIDRGTRPAPEVLADIETNLKNVLRAA